MIPDLFFTYSCCCGNLDEEMSLIDKQKSISSVSQLKKLGDKCSNGGYFRHIHQVNTSIIGMLIHVFSVFCWFLTYYLFSVFFAIFVKLLDGSPLP